MRISHSTILSSAAALAALETGRAFTLPSSVQVGQSRQLGRLRPLGQSSSMPQFRRDVPLKMADVDETTELTANGATVVNGANGANGAHGANGERQESSSTSSTTLATTSTMTMEEEEEGESHEINGWSLGAVPSSLDEGSKKKKVAREALMKLLERQQRDVQQTLDLISNLDLQDTSFYEPESDVNATHASSETNATSPTDKVPTIAYSAYSGFDYGYISRSEGPRTQSLTDFTDPRFEGYGPPGNVFQLGSAQFMRNLRAMFNEYRDEEDVTLTPQQVALQKELNTLTLNSTAIWERERAHGPLIAPWIIKIPYYVLCYFLDVVFENRNPFSRFFLLETVARMPYFSYITMLHLYETLGFWRRSSDVKRIHFAEEWNEFHHLLIMESLGGDQPYWVRFMAQHSALAYYVALCILWMMGPSLSYKFSEMLEGHAVDTYGQFLDENEDKLKKLPPSLAAVEYYTVGVSDPMFGEYQTAGVKNPEGEDGQGREYGVGGIRRPGANLRTLYDVFRAIRNDEGDHVSTMKACLDPKEPVLSPGLESRVLTGVALAASVGFLFGSGGVIGGGGGVDGSLLDGLTNLADSMTDVATNNDLDTVLSESGNLAGESANSIETALDALIGGMAGFGNWLVNGGASMEGAELDEDVAGSALEGLSGGLEGGLSGLELEAVFEFIKSLVIGLLELLPFL